MTWAHAAWSVDKLDNTAEDGAVNDRAASDLNDHDLVGFDLDTRAQFVAGTFRSALMMKSRTVLGGAGALRVRHGFAGTPRTPSFERVVRSGERCSPHGGSTPR
jgi:hypothetical protein